MQILTCHQKNFFSETSPDLKDLYCKPIISHPTLIFSVESMLCRTTRHFHQHSQNIYTVTPFALLQMAPNAWLQVAWNSVVGNACQFDFPAIHVYHGMLWIHKNKKNDHFFPRINKSAGLPRLDPKHPMAIHMFSSLYNLSVLEVRGSYLSVQHTGT